jgi:hypothetical protein
LYGTSRGWVGCVWGPCGRLLTEDSPVDMHGVFQGPHVSGGPEVDGVDVGARHRGWGLRGYVLGSGVRTGGVHCSCGAL